MTSNWQYLGDVCERIVDCPHSTPKWTDHGFIVLRNQNIRNGRLDLSSPSYTDAKHYNHRINRAKPVAGDIIFTREAPMGDVCIIPDGLQCCVGQRQVLLRPAKTINSKYLLYAMQSSFVRNQVLWNEGTGSVVSNVRIPVLKKLKIPRFDAEHEQYLVNTLSSLDDKIELNQRMNNTLEGITQALFKSWFVDFDPVKAKTEGREPEGMDDAIADLFPSSFIESPLGLIPQGWEVKGLDEIATFLNGLALQKYPALDPENYLPVIKISQLRAGNTEGADKASTDVPPDYIITDGDILFSWSGSLEVEIWCGGRGALNQHLFKVSSKDFPKWFYFMWTRQHLDNFQKIAASKATTMGHIQRKHLSEAKVICPL